MLIPRPPLAFGAATLPALAPLAALADEPALLPNGSTGAQPVDLLYVLGVLGVLGFGGLQVFRSFFPENFSSDEYLERSPTSGVRLPSIPFLGDGAPAQSSPEEAAEELRVRLQEAAQAGDLATAYRLEKELIQLLSESGVRYIVEDDPDAEDSREALPKNW